MRHLCLDIGEKRVGVAVSDPSGRVATPLTVLDAATLASDASALERIADDYEVGALVVGLPVQLSGDEGPQATNVRRQAERLAAAVGLPLVYQDERLSSAEAKRAMRTAGVPERDARGSVDMVAATIVLQAYLDEHSGTANDGEDT